MSEAVQLDAEPIVKDNRTLVPLGFVAFAFGCTIDWGPNSKIVTILKRE